MPGTEFTTVVASVTAIGGILIKMTYDSAVARIDSQRSRADRFLEERKTAYDEFLSNHRKVVRSREFIYEITLIARAHKDVKPGVLENAPPSYMRELVESFNALRKLARTNRIVKISQRMIMLHGDASGALRKFLTDDSPYYGLDYFLICRLQEDQELEFIARYRQDLGLKPPVGAPKNYPVVKRPWPLSFAEHILHTHLKSWPKEIAKTDEARALTKKDVGLLQSPRFKELILETTAED